MPKAGAAASATAKKANKVFAAVAAKVGDAADAAHSAGEAADDDDDDDDDAPRNLTISESLELLFERHGADHPRHDADYRQVMLGSGSGGDSTSSSDDDWFARLLRAVGLSSFSRGGGRDTTRPRKPSVQFGPQPKPEGTRNAAARFGDPLNSPLPHAPNLKIFCLHGGRKSTERAYHRVHRPNQVDRPFALTSVPTATAAAAAAARRKASPWSTATAPPLCLWVTCVPRWRTVPKAPQPGWCEV